MNTILDSLENNCNTNLNEAIEDFKLFNEKMEKRKSPIWNELEKSLFSDDLNNDFF